MDYDYGCCCCRAFAARRCRRATPDSDEERDIYARISRLEKCCCAAPDSDEERDESDDDSFDFSKKKESNIKENENMIKNEFNFDDFILSQDVIEGNWTKDAQCKILIEQEEDIYEKIKKYSEEKGVKEENGIITLFALYYIYNKKSDKVNELKFVINKAKDYVKKIFNLGYDDIIKEIEV